ncbi:acyl-CoA thioester hydrolase [Lysobacter sp. HA35]
MTDQPPPPSSDKKPRRARAPRKRAPAKRAPKAKQGTEAVIALDADGASVEVAGDALLTEAAPAEVAAAPLSSTQVTAEPATPQPGATANAPAEQRETTAQQKPQGGRQPRQPRDDKSREVEKHAELREASPAAEAQAPTPESAASESTAPMKQDSLRPGELIRVPLSVRWRDLDAFNHVNNSKYLSYLEEARLRWMLSVPGMGLDENVAPVVAASNLNYRRPIEWPGDVVIELFVERLGGSSVTIGHRIVDAKDPRALYCDGNVVMVWIDRTTGRSAPLPTGVRDACS